MSRYRLKRLQGGDSIGRMEATLEVSRPRLNLSRLRLNMSRPRLNNPRGKRLRPNEAEGKMTDLRKPEWERCELVKRAESEPS